MRLFSDAGGTTVLKMSLACYARTGSLFSPIEEAVTDIDQDGLMDSWSSEFPLPLSCSRLELDIM